MPRFQFQSLLRIIVSPFWRFGLPGALALTLVIEGHGSDLSGLNFAPPDNWVRPQFFGPQSPGIPSDAGADDRLLLMESQADAVGNEVFYHSDRKVLSIAGVEHDSTVKIDFNPDY